MGQFGNGQVIYVRPPAKEKSAVAALWCRWSFSVEPAICGFYYGIWSTQPPFPVSDPPNGDKYTAFLGFRYETPERGDNHNYYHAQPCRSMGPGDEPIGEALPVSERNPTWPLPADSPLELLLCLVTSLYGMSGLRDLRSRVLENPQTRGNRVLCQSLDRLLTLQRNGENG